MGKSCHVHVNFFAFMSTTKKRSLSAIAHMDISLHQMSYHASVRDHLQISFGFFFSEVYEVNIGLTVTPLTFTKDQSGLKSLILNHM